MCRKARRRDIEEGAPPRLRVSPRLRGDASPSSEWVTRCPLAVPLGRASHVTPRCSRAASYSLRLSSPDSPSPRPPPLLQPGTPDQAPPAESCDSSDPCACVQSTPGETCTAHGASCTCAPNAADSGPGDAGDSAPPAPPDMGVFVGKWSPISGTGQANCGGQITSLPPNPGAILTFVQDGPSTLAATSSRRRWLHARALRLRRDRVARAGSRDLPSEYRRLGFVHDVYARLHTLVRKRWMGEIALKRASARVTRSRAWTRLRARTGLRTTLHRVRTRVQTTHLCRATGAPAMRPRRSDAGADSAPTSSDAGTDGASSGGDAGAGSNVQLGTLDWQLGDSDGTCLTTLHYTLVRSP